jgi:hypothetical protein
MLLHFDLQIYWCNGSDVQPTLCWLFSYLDGRPVHCFILRRHGNSLQLVRCTRMYAKGLSTVRNKVGYIQCSQP